MPTLNWMGKEKVVNHHRDVPYRVLERVPEKGVLDSCGSDCGNMIIHGDNLEALKALLPEYEGKVDCIYIDPPYNTGNEGWVYNDNVNDPRIKKWLGQVVGKEGEDFSRHDKWLCMMYPRLQLLRRLLAPTGAIFISIDDNEFCNLKQTCDEVFGCGNFRSDVIWQKRYTRSNNTVDFTNVTEHILVYSKSPDFVVNLLPRNESTDRSYTNPDNDPRGPWMTSSFVNPATKEARPALVYEIEAPDGRKVIHPTHAWKQSKENYERLNNEGRFWWGQDGNARYPRLKQYLSEARGLTPINFWSHEYAGNTDMGGNELKAIMGEKVFDYPKPSLLIRRVLEHATKKDSLVLDAFAGSGTTAQAVLQKNHEDGGSRRFLLIEMSDYADPVTAERIRRVIRGYGTGDDAVEGIDSGFSYYELGPVLFMGDGSLNPEVSVDDLKRYVWYSETRAPYEDHAAEHPYLLGESRQAVYYLAFEPGGETELTYDLLRGLPRKGAPTVIYADRCSIAPERLDEMGIVFKQVPRQIARM
ncbi:site-specific DNA-methyltransferase [Collinsella ihumii]|uniref:site-specific DNA-methyltransferase n=1 Tax=Collinsella ihumii TaxID=1720204 RepID=UPI0025AA5803|nr:site-specific DNA-methyltransferase [Collinsella ihumii]MDN0056351.1 site-specific DNA-methyltransferase [Collinsella ihumii]